ncbi:MULTISPECIES: hypothetical protein [Burkholderia]|uniref:Lipoprotein n=2 Tax=Burkholderia TaxID=32008 RepID=A0A365R1F1_9BURK|nr:MULTISPECIES: hypothetical protein [Burkholderia]AIO27889.1 hypothetical protein DM41_4340 [Burkholderia cepacia ATCC 25416]ALK21056.1 hypothetical protein APZ15_25015 [Burkholderia cepacia ATCC 25416]ASE98875.1 hypothetical protein CEQ23_36965 [Burkholderia cepacia]ATF82860.1 hypothetical protein CO711_37320 [Burkholderia cepacia]MCA7894384.1 hypothetical protein [Burkholderia cepacia]
MVKTFAVCGALCLVATGFARFHETVAQQPAPARAFATNAQRVSVRHATGGEPAVAPSSNDGDAGRQAAAAQVADKPPVIALGVAHAGWSVLFSH